MNKYFENFDLSNFWEQREYAFREYVSPPPTDEMIGSVERELGYRLPASYIELMKNQNGGVPVNTCALTQQGTSWAKNHVALSGIFGIGREKPGSLCGDSGSEMWIETWGYPTIGIYFADCPSAGHDMICMDYRKCGESGEPEIVHVDQERDFKITFLAKDFETFIKSLVNEEEFD